MRVPPFIRLLGEPIKHPDFQDPIQEVEVAYRDYPIDPFQCWVRRNDRDEDLKILRELHSPKSWLRAPVESQIVLDIGAHGGFYSLAALAGRASRVISCEPDPENFRLLHRNMFHLETTTQSWRAVVRDGPRRLAYLRRHPKSSVAHSLHYNKRSKDVIAVPTVSIRDLYDRYQPTVVKIDAEGAVYDLLDVNLPSSVEWLAIETEFPGKTQGSQVHHNLSLWGETVVVPKLSNIFYATGVYKKNANSRKHPNL